MIGAHLALLATDVTSVLAQSDQQQPGGQGPEFGKAAPIGLLVVLLLLIATVLLVRSMNRKLTRLPTTFDQQPGDDVVAPEEERRG